MLFRDFDDSTGTNGTAAFADSKTLTCFHSDRLLQGDVNRKVVPRHNHLNTFSGGEDTGHVSCTEVELRAVAGEERGMTTAFFLGQNVNFSLGLA